MAWSPVQGKGGNFASGGTATFQFASAPALGDVIVIAASSGVTGPDTISVSDNNGNTWNSSDPNTLDSGDTLETFWSVVTSTTPNANPTYTITWAGTTHGLRFAAAELAPPGSGTITRADHGTAGSSTAQAPGTVTTIGSAAATGDLVVGLYRVNANGTYTAGTGYALISGAVDVAAPSSRVVLEWKTATGSGAQSATISDTATSSWTANILVLNQAAGGATPSDTDSGTLTDTANQIGVNGPSDSSSVGESNAIGTGSSDSAALAEQNAIKLLQTDSAAFAEQVAITVSAAASDSATVTDSASANAGQVSKSDTDSAALAESIKIALTATDSAQLGESMAIALAHQDTATLQELVSVALAIADAATLSEGATVTAQTAASDTATLSGESSSVNQQGSAPSSSDTGTLADSASSTAAVSTSDIGSLAEQAAIALKATDLVAMTEQIGLGLVTADNAALTEQLRNAVSNAANDPVTLGELQNVVASVLAAAETASVSDTARVTQNGVSSSALKILTLPTRSLRFTVAARGFIFTLPKP